jgi:histidinol-phosphatase
MSESLPEGFELARPGRAPISDQALQEALTVAHQACDRARAEIMPRYRNVSIETKDDGSPVTEADLAAEKAIRETIEAAFPEDAILGEEFGEKAGQDTGKGRRRWIIDPIDGTIAFSRGIPLFTTLIALLVDDEPVMRAI